MGQGPHWTLPDNSLNMELYYKVHLHLIENGKIKFSKLIIETLQDVLSPQSSKSSSSSSYNQQSSLIRSPPPSSVPRSNLLSIQTPSQSSSSQSLSATATPFNPKRQNFCLILRLLHQNHKHWLHRHPFTKISPNHSRQFLTIFHLLNQLSS